MRKFEAEDELRKIIAAATGSAPRKNGSVTFQWFTLERFVPMREGNWRPATKRGNLFDIQRYILPTLGALALKSIDKFQVASLLNKLAKTYSEPVVARVRVMLCGILEEAEDQDYIDKNPARKISLPRCRVSLKPVLPPEMLRMILTEVTDLRDKLILLIGTFCAVRTSEVLGLTWNSYTGDSLLIQNIAWEGKLYQRQTKTEKSNAPVYVPAEIRQLLDVYRGQANPQSDNELMFPSLAGTPLSARNFLQRRIYPIAKRLGIDPHLVTFQILRRSCATRNQRHGSMKDVQSHLRHARIETTGNIYMQPVLESVRNMVEADLADVMGPASASKIESVLIN
jgi:integrase